MQTNKELLSKILNIDIPDDIGFTYGSKFENNVKQTIVMYYNDGSEPIYMNIYELAHKVKKWIITIGFALNITLDNFCVINIRKTKVNIIKIVAETELEAIFKAGEWVYNKIKEI